MADENRCSLWCMMHSDNVEAGTMTLEKLRSTGWVEEEDLDEGVSKDWHKSLGTADGLMNPKNEIARVWDHDERWTDDEGRKREASQASMGNAVNGIDGYIIGGGNFGPRDTAPAMPEWERPKTKWTDILAVQWKQYAAGNALNRVYRSNVVYPESRDLIETALEKIGKSGDVADLPLWPGIDFTPGRNPTKMPMKPATEAFMGLLGSSHAAGPAYLTIQYRAIFGKKEISKITVWKVENKPSANMLIYMEDIP